MAKEPLSEPGIIFDYNHLMASSVKSAEHGVTDAELEALAPLAARYAREIAQERREGKLEFMDLRKRQAAADEVIRLGGELRDRFENFVVLGIGGSALGCQALQTALAHPYHNLLHRNRRRCPRIFILDNVDPDQLTAFLDTIDVTNTVFNVISKSGGTVETAAQYLIVRDLLVDQLGPEYKEHIVVTTDPKQGSLRAIAKKEGYRTLDIPPGIGGRFSVFTPVGLLSATVARIDAHKLLAGAAAMDARVQTEEIRRNPALLNGAIHHLLDVKKGKHISVMMPYSAALKDVADWYRQLWAESLGKKLGLDGREVYTGQTPVKALGVTDQHSQVQLYAEGPFDKVFTFLAVKEFDGVLTVPERMKDVEGCGYLAGRTINDLMEAERRGTEIALTQAGRPNCTITLPRVSAHAVGQLLYMLEVQTAYAGKFYRINAFDQPGVEAGKVAAFALMGRSGYEEQRRQIESGFAKSEKYVVR
jgi:glucose-6-phosphate isomerase